MAQIPNLTLDAAKAALSPDFLKRINDDIMYERCIWCKPGQVNKKKHALIDCPTARPSPADRTKLSHDIFNDQNPNQQDFAVAYIHHRQLEFHPRPDGATTFTAGRLRTEMKKSVAQVPTTPAALPAPVPAASVPPSAVHTHQPTSMAQPPPAVLPVPPTSFATSAHSPLPVVPQPTVSSATQQTPTGVVATPTGQISSGLANVSLPPASGSMTSVPVEVTEAPVSRNMVSGRQRPFGRDIARDGTPFGSSEDTVKKLQKLLGHNVTAHFPPRQGFAKSTHTVYTNHYAIGIASQTVLYEYKILPSIPGKNKRKIRAIIEAAIKDTDFLQINQQNFATDYFDTIIAWKSLHTSIGTGYPKLSGDGEAGSEWKLNTFVESGTQLPLRFRFEGVVDTQPLFLYKSIDPGYANADIQPIIRALNILISKCFDESKDYQTMQTGANKFYLKDAYEVLSNGKKPGPEQKLSQSLCTIRGYSYTIKAGIERILLNVNAATSAFFLAVSLDRVFTDDLAFSNFKDRDFNAPLRGLRVYINYERGDKLQDPEAWERLNSEKGRIKTIQDLGAILSVQQFELESGDVWTVQDYFESTYGRTLTHPDLPAVNLGSRQEPRWYCPEDLILLPYQMYKGLVPDAVTAGMLDTACHIPYDAAALVDVEALETVEVPRDTITPLTLAKCPVITIDPRMLKVPSAQEPYPTIQYGNDSTLQAKDRWNTKGLALLDRNQNTLFKGTIIASSGMLKGWKVSPASCTKDLRQFAGGPTTKGTQTIPNYSVATMQFPSGEVKPVNTGSRTAVDSALNKAAATGTNFALLILRNKSAESYAHFKDLCDRKWGFHSLCVTQTALNGSGRGQLMGNLMLKMNLKTGGSNHCVADGKMKEIMPNTLVLGADVTHPGKGSITGCPSIAAIVGSVDGLGGRFLGSMRLQSKDKKEIIDEVKAMVVERIIDWVEEHGGTTLPTNILYYRDGVGDSQYRDIKTTELPQIQLAFDTVVTNLKNKKSIPSTANPKINITAIVCAKRHNTRFYPGEGDEDSFNNCHPGTFVDDVVCSPYYQDFYLQSHCALKGTARPTHYFVIQNDMSNSVDDLRQLTHELCYSYVRATVGVSYASPAYYADKLCERGRIYLRDFFVRTGNGEARRSELETFKHKKEDELSKIRIQQFGAERLANGRKRPKTLGELEMESKDKKKVEDECKEWVMKKAKKEMYGGEDAPGRNPWHANIRKTMFWM